MIAGLIAPLTNAGGDVRAGGVGFDLYLFAKDERAAARVAEREAIAGGDPDVDPLAVGLRHWRGVAEAGAELVGGHAKDLQVAAWMVEAWVRIDGFAGLADGFALLAALVETYWDGGLLPAEDEDGVETRVAPLLGLLGREDPGTLIQPIKLLPLTDAGTEPIALWTVETLRAQGVRHDDPDEREQLQARRVERVAAIDAAIAGASPGFAAANIAAIERALAELDRLMEAVDTRAPFGRFGSQVTRPLEEALALIRTAAPADEGLFLESAADASAATEPAAANRPAATCATRTRASALAQVLEVASFFDATEPQSMIGRSLRDVVRRANMSLDDLLAELLPENDQRRLFLLRAGIRQPAETDTYSSY